jgi:hypothetical protein
MGTKVDTEKMIALTRAWPVPSSSNIENLKTERRHANQYRKFRVCM